MKWAAAAKSRWPAPRYPENAADTWSPARRRRRTASAPHREAAMQQLPRRLRVHSPCPPPGFRFKGGNPFSGASPTTEHRLTPPRHISYPVWRTWCNPASTAAPPRGGTAAGNPGYHPRGGSESPAHKDLPTGQISLTRSRANQQGGASPHSSSSSYLVSSVENVV